MESITQFLAHYGWFIVVPLVFLIIVIYVFRPGARRRYEQDARIPFQDAPDKKGTDDAPRRNDR
jgi:cbb3-type cytochrome oxidase subunit 3